MARRSIGCSIQARRPGELRLLWSRRFRLELSLGLIGNYNVFNKSAGRWLAGSTVAGASNAYCRSNYNRNSDWRSSRYKSARHPPRS